MVKTSRAERIFVVAYPIVTWAWMALGWLLVFAMPLHWWLTR